ncbi:MAG: DUF89 family protein [Clostridia bacterium]|nr:DUF89 family protein [Clostridia bacterium]
MNENLTWDQLDHGDVHHLLSLECLNCALNQLISATELANMPEARRIALMQEAFETVAKKGIDRNNCEIIEEVYRIATRTIGDENPYREVKSHFNRGMMRLWPEVRRHIAESDNPLAAAVRAAIAGNLIDLAALGLDVSLDIAMAKVHEVDRIGMYIDETASLADALSKAKTLLVLGDNCGEIAMDRLLIETIRKLYPHLHVQYGVRGTAVVNDVTREDAAEVGMDEIAEIIDNGDCVLGTLLYRTSPEFNESFYNADVVICKGMGNYEGLHGCDRGNMWFLLIAKCNTMARLTKSPKGSILCLRKEK